METTINSPSLSVDKSLVVEDGSMEGARRATGVEPSSAAITKVPDPEVVEQKTRRKFTASYKLRIVQEADRCSKSGEVGKILRREGLYSSHLTNWRRAIEKGQLNAVAPQKRGRKPKEENPLATEITKLQKEKRKLEQKLKRAELIIDAQKKISQILGIHQNLENLEESSL